MSLVTVSPKYQVVIPKEVRKVIKLKPGEKAEIIPYENRIELILIKNIKKMRGFLKGINTMVQREGDRL